MEEKRRWKIGCMALGLLALAGVGLMAVVLVSRAHERDRITVFTGKRVAVVRIEEMILSSDRIVDRLEECRRDNSVPAVLLRINSPGGGVAACQEIYEAVRRVKAGGKPVVASLGSVAASGGYYIACAADTIVANPGTVTGSIGVIFEFPYFHELMKKVGVDMEVIKSGKYKDAGSFHRRMTDEERRLFQELINDTWDQFVEAVAEGRAMDTAAVRRLADGRVFTGRQALAKGLVDVMGTFEDARETANAMAGLPEDTETFEFRSPEGMMKWLFRDFEESLKQKAFLPASGLMFLFTE